MARRYAMARLLSTNRFTVFHFTFPNRDWRMLDVENPFFSIELRLIGEIESGGCFMNNLAKFTNVTVDIENIAIEDGVKFQKLILHRGTIPATIQDNCPTRNNQKCS
ncbi:unnamed protein product [Heterotrigona itama]|uniref:Uncharacterized protein n=1 Tax=Heterotrigona itama TaxID=395501 RepID=A0A6V7GVM2_9HYME|nr:unnamed protein product [Heterotrigona itama]